MKVSEAVKKFLVWVKRHRSEKTHEIYSDRIKRLPELLGNRTVEEDDGAFFDRWKVVTNSRRVGIHN